MKADLNFYYHNGFVFAEEILGSKMEAVSYYG